jgi:hypothetical protein
MYEHLKIIGPNRLPSLAEIPLWIEAGDFVVMADEKPGVLTTGLYFGVYQLQYVPDAAVRRRGYQSAFALNLSLALRAEGFAPLAT